MITRLTNKVLSSLSLVLAFFTFVASYFGVFVSGTYSKETLNWAAQAIGQDAVSLLLVVPLLVILSVLVYKKNAIAAFLWAGVMAYLVYSYAISCFAMHFGELFLVYCLIFGLSFYALLYFLYAFIDAPIATWFEAKVPVKAAGAFLIIIAIIFYVIWLSAAVPAVVTNTTPQDITAAGLLTNPVYVLDLSIFLPGIILTAILALKKKELGLLLVPVLIFFIVLMTAAIAGISISMDFFGVASGLAVAILMGMLSIVSAIILMIYVESVQKSYRTFSV
jgi:hypothetical protein